MYCNIGSWGIICISGSSFKCGVTVLCLRVVFVYRMWESKWAEHSASRPQAANVCPACDFTSGTSFVWPHSSTVRLPHIHRAAFAHRVPNPESSEWQGKYTFLSLTMLIACYRLLCYCMLLYSYTILQRTVRFDVLRAMLLNIQVVWNVTLCYWGW
jgi:hypothetical protein